MSRTNLDKIVVIHQVIPLPIVIPDQLQDLGLLQLKPERSHGHLELVVIDRSIMILIEQLESLLDLLLLLLRELPVLLRLSA